MSLCRPRFVPYLTFFPRRPPPHVQILDTMPRNAMGKVNKKDLVKACFPEEVAAAQAAQ